DRASMKNSLEVRVPLLDPRLVQFVNALPLRLKINGPIQKRLLRRLLVGICLPELAERPKQGFAIPLKSCLWGRVSADTAHLRLAPDIRLSCLLDIHEVRQLLGQSRKGGRDLTERVWALFWLEHWLRECNS